MNDVTQETTQETPAAKAAKKKTEYIKVKMEDGRDVEFPVTRKVSAEVLTDSTGASTGVRFDFVNGSTRSLMVAALPATIVNYSACHGLKQKVADDWAGAKDEAGQPATIDDIVLMCDDMLARLSRGEWSLQRAAGDSMAGASIVIQAIAAVYGKTANEVKAYLDSQLETMKKAAEAAGATPPTRQKLYATFRKPGSAIAKKIAEIEAERAAKNSVGNAEDLLAGLAAA